MGSLCSAATVHSPQELAEIEALAEDEDEEIKPASKKGKYSGAAAKRTRPEVHAVLFIHVGREDRAPMEKGCFDTFMNCANLEIAKMVWTDQRDPSKSILFPWNFWSKEQES